MKLCPKCVGYGVSTDEGNVFVIPPPPTCTFCSGSGQVEDNVYVQKIDSNGKPNPKVWNKVRASRNA